MADTVATLLGADPVRVPHPFCQCGHNEGHHRIDLKNPACTSAACGCLYYRAGKILYRESRWTE